VEIQQLNKKCKQAVHIDRLAPFHLSPDKVSQTETGTEPIEPETQNFGTEMFPNDSESRDRQLDYQLETQSLDTQSTEPR